MVGGAGTGFDGYPAGRHAVQTRKRSIGGTAAATKYF